jgi:hypothetical protein
MDHQQKYLPIMVKTLQWIATLFSSFKINQVILRALLLVDASLRSLQLDSQAHLVTKKTLLRFVAKFVNLIATIVMLL